MSPIMTDKNQPLGNHVEEETKEGKDRILGNTQTILIR